MKPLHALLSLTALFALLAGSNFGLAQGSGDGGCPDKKATQVGATIDEVGSSRTCGLGIKIFGFGGSILGAKCPEHEVRTPAHQECLGDEAQGSKCVPEADMIVDMRDCACGGLVVPVIETGFPISCRCGDWFAGGTVEDFQTVSCTL